MNRFTETLTNSAILTSLVVRALHGLLLLLPSGDVLVVVEKDQKERVRKEMIKVKAKESRVTKVKEKVKEPIGQKEHRKVTLKVARLQILCRVPTVKENQVARDQELVHVTSVVEMDI